MLWEMLILFGMILPVLFVWHRIKELRGYEKEGRMIKFEKVLFEALIISLVFFSLAGILGFFDFAMSFIEPLDKIIVILPVLVPLVVSTLLITRELGEKIRRGDYIVLAVFIVFIFLLVSLFSIIPMPYVPIVYLLMFLSFAELFSRIVRRFFHGTPMSGELRAKVEELCRRANVNVEEVYIIDEERIGAFVTGMKGKTIFITKGAIEKLNEMELLAVIAHELGHVKRRHALKRELALVFGLSLPIIGYYMGGDIPLFLSFVMSIALVFYSTFQLAKKFEIDADRFAASLVGPINVIKALEKVYKKEGLPKRTPRWYNIIHSHPSLEERVRALEAAFPP
ncbi:M48 family metallopeptidase [Pyrococcus abyssi]|uniref:Caax prenyl protease 1 related n=1 Tax=Pyrococcus abyssi (strain GE5 / Orsay) TaxID=272844 RepID=Q9V0G6_PYRAB|nr:M48 family metallopeptidase [Pyrococcus abyssi]CAB49737.1 Heat shock protein/ Zn-dependent protease with chaperone function, family M48 [Pyrococcus abyssi GE5]CCE70225.1 TPA: caax prenyl protease 1 related [Pyrococcus abyssi GE5]